MRNLKTINLLETELPNGLPLTATAWDVSDDSVVCAFGPSEANPVIELKRTHPQKSLESPAYDKSGLEFIPITSWDAPSPLTDLACDEILLLQYFPHISTSCLVLAGGDVVVVRENPERGQEKIEIVGSVDAGIAAAAWSPDEELLAIASRADTLILMSRHFEPITDLILTADDLKASNHVSVGWGKKETQFQGKKAKALRDPTIPEVVDEGKLSPLDDGKSTITWRGDGAFFAINSIVSATRRAIRVYSREAVLDSVSEPVDGLESGLSWKPSGSLIAGVQRLDDRLDIVFFERNGLRHGQFPLRLSLEDVKSWGSSISISWNFDSTVLAVSFTDRVQLWTTGNYHYYLKQEVMCSYDRAGSAWVPVRWHPEKPLLCSISTLGSILHLEFAFSVDRGSTIRLYDHGTVAVIDGRFLRLTPMKHATIPPPMSYCQIYSKYNILDCSISLSGQYIALLTTSTFEIYDWKLEAIPSTEVRQALMFDLPKPTSTYPRVRYFRVMMRKQHDAFILGSTVGNLFETKRLRLGGIQELSGQAHSQMLEQFQENWMERTTCSVLTDTYHKLIWAQDAFGIGIWDLASNSRRSSQREGFAIGSHPWVEIVYCGTGVPKPDFSEPQDKKYTHDYSDFRFFSLSKVGDLFVGDRLLARNCTSFLVTDAYLLFTTSQHLLKLVHIAREGDLEVPSDTPEVDERCRSIERGATLITVIPSTYAVVFQMPRGNIETIYPRALVLAGIRQHIDDRDYKSAFLACRSHQVQMDILHDYRPDLFMTNITMFIDQVKTVSRIDNFLSKLVDEDVTQTMYRETLKDYSEVRLDPDHAKDQAVSRRSSPNLDTTRSKGKVNRICDAFISVLQVQMTTHLQNLVTAHVCRRPPDLEAALLLVSDLRRKNPKQADAAVEHLCFLTDANRLFDTALSLYDLDLTLLVAQQSQRDPREYMPFLHSLLALSNLRRRFQIDDHLRNYQKALDSLHAMSRHDEVEAYVVKHSLYTSALELYKYDHLHLSSITALYASNLKAQSRYDDAAIAYEFLGDFASAYPNYALAHNWRGALTCASLVPISPDQLRTLAESLATTCIEDSRDFRSAATIHVDYLSDIPGAARLLCKGSYFSDASRILALHQLHDDLTPQIIDTGLTDKFGEIIELLADCKAQLNSQVPRIGELRIKKSEDPLTFFGGDPAAGEGGPDIPDNVSLAPTDSSTAAGRSLFTRYGTQNSRFGGTVASNASSRMTSKTKRREERKRARGKKGSVYEEEYLVNSVARLIGRVNGTQEEVRRLVVGLLRRGMWERAKVVDERMKEMEALCKDATQKVWDEMGRNGEEDVAEEEYGVNGVGRPSGANGVFWDSQVEGQSKKEAPAVKEWKVVGLLGDKR